MNIIKNERIRITYSAECSDCGVRGPFRLTPQSAEETASLRGWMVESKFNGLCWVSITRCPFCAVDHEETKNANSDGGLRHRT